VAALRLQTSNLHISITNRPNTMILNALESSHFTLLRPQHFYYAKFGIGNSDFCRLVMTGPDSRTHVAFSGSLSTNRLASLNFQYKAQRRSNARQFCSSYLDGESTFSHHVCKLSSRQTGTSANLNLVSISFKPSLSPRHIYLKYMSSALVTVGHSV
jgi:hypothetical protein